MMKNVSDWFISEGIEIFFGRPLIMSFNEKSGMNYEGFVNSKSKFKRRKKLELKLKITSKEIETISVIQ